MQQQRYLCRAGFPLLRGTSFPRVPWADGETGLTRWATHTPAFTLLETLVVISIMALLISMLLPALRSARATVAALECSSNMRSATMKFQFFADGRGAQGRGDSEALGSSRFWINDFQESLYHIDEFWDLGAQTEGTLKADGELMLCQAGARQLVKRRGFPCSVEAVGPTENVSLAMNMRLYRGVVEFKGRSVLAPRAATYVPSRILHHPYVPLIMDVDGSKAIERGLEPFYIAPPLGERSDPYANGRYWMPSKRHHGKTNVAFIGGHVLSSTDPEREHWDWAYQAEVGR